MDHARSDCTPLSALPDTGSPSGTGTPGNDILTGRVTDLTGRPVADAQVGATSLGTGITRSHSTDADGRYKIYFPETAQKYALSVKRIGFSPVQRTIARRTSGPEEMTIDVQFGIRMLLSKSQEAGDATQMAGSVAMMLEEAGRNTRRAVVEAEKLLREDQRIFLPLEITERLDSASKPQASMKR